MANPEASSEIKTPVDLWRLLKADGLFAALEALSFGQIYATVATVAALATAAIALLPRSDDLVLCADASDYPKGMWLQAGRTLEYDLKAYPEGPPAMGDSIVFDGPTNGQTDLWTDNYDAVYPGQSRQSGEGKIFWAARSTYWVKREDISHQAHH